MDYSGKIPIHGNGQKALDKAQSIFIKEGFSVSPLAGHGYEALVSRDGSVAAQSAV
jgi:hypothetical protein